MRTLLVTFLSLACVPAIADWTPPENPSPTAILNSARDDVRHQQYEDALAKHVWYHENALKHDQGQGGVRLSFALSDWMKLGELHPPALEKLKQIRDQSGKESKKSADPFQKFQDFAAINRVLADEKKTVKLFKALDQRDSEKAKRVFGVAKPALIRAKEYALCGKYLDPPREVSQIIDVYHLNGKQVAKFDQKFSDFREKSFANGSTTLVALLVVNDRKDEARQAAKAFRQERNDADYRAALDKALEGEVPEPWP